MTIWRRKKADKTSLAEMSEVDSLSIDPFEMDEPARFEDQNNELDMTFVGQETGAEHGPKIHRSLRSVMTYTFLAAAVVATGFVIAKTRPWSFLSRTELVYAYFEVRAVDQSGRPVAGAVVKNAGKKVGTTDSFGEWRRYMRVPLGSTVPITIAKTSNSDFLYATKNFAVPPAKPEKNDMELRASVQLIASAANGHGTVADATVQGKSASELREDTADSSKRDEETLVGMKNNVTSNASKTEPAADSTSAVASSGAGSFTSSHEGVWFEAMGSAASPLSKEVLPALVQRAKELGLKLDPKSEWRVRLTGLVDRPAVLGADGGGLILVSSFDSTQTAAYDFLRNYQADPRVTARGILFVLSHVVRKNISAVKENGRWIAALPRTSAQLWHLNPGMSFAGAVNQVWSSTTEVFKNEKLQGVYLKQQGEDAPCGAGKSSCELNLRTYAEVPPVPSWVKMKAKTQINTKDQVKIFVSGYEARVVSDNVIEYWGQDRGRVNVTVIHAGRVVHRAQVVNDLRTPPTIAVSSAALSKR